MKRAKIKYSIPIAITIIISLLLLVAYNYYLPISKIKIGTLDYFGNQSISDLANSNLENQHWTVDHISNESAIVYVDGYSFSFEESIKMGFYYLEMDTEFILFFESISFLDSNRNYTMTDNHIEMLELISILYGNSEINKNDEISSISNKINT